MTEEVPTFLIEGVRLGSAASLAAFGAAFHDIFAVEAVDVASTSPIDVEAWHLGTIMLASVTGPALFFDRPPALVAQSGLDHFLVQYYAEGSFSGMAGSGPIRVTPGDICILDLTDTLSTRSEPFSNHSLLIPRDALRPALDDLTLLHGLVIPGTTPLATILADYLVSLCQRIRSLDRREALLAAQATVSMASTIIAGEAQRFTKQNYSGRKCSPMRSVSEFIDTNIRDPDLDAEKIARGIGISRASLYRLMAASGGVGRYIRRRRLSGAALELSHPTRHLRVGDVAMRWGFGNDASFSRAFRQEFGIAPRAARERSFALLDPRIQEHGAASAEQQFSFWLRSLQASAEP